ncbi:MAG: Uma2 family endonuclease [Chloroflexi bacterium]|nr:Uma2 family endonuclease [Chloroflexota bacterium]
MVITSRWTSADLDLLPEDGRRYEIIDGELFMSRQPHWHHQRTCSRLCAALDAWSRPDHRGQANIAPGLIFAEDDDVAPDVVWISTARLRHGLRDGKLYTAPELVVEVLSPGSTNERRDREAKLKLYARRGVDEYWIADWRTRAVELFRRTSTGLERAATLHEGDTLTSPLLPCFSLSLEELFAD